MALFVLPVAEATTARLREHLETVWTPQLEENVHSGYARGRMQAWLRWQPTLVKNWTREPRPDDEVLWKFLSQYYTKGYGYPPELGLVTIAGNITPHRDSTYAHPECMTLSIGKCTWGYSENRNGVDLTWRELDGGNLIFFDCKHEHAVKDVAADRWSVSAWRFK